MPRPRIFNFIPEKFLGTVEESKDEIPTVTVMKHGILRFSKTAAQKFGFVDGVKIIMLVTPEKERIGWQFFKEGTFADLKHVHEIKKYVSGKEYPVTNYQVAIGRFLKKAGIKVEKTMKRLRIEEYNSQVEKDRIYHVKLEY